MSGLVGFERYGEVGRKKKSESGHPSEESETLGRRISVLSASLRKANRSPIIVITAPDNCEGAGSLSGPVSAYPFSISSVTDLTHIPGRDPSAHIHTRQRHHIGCGLPESMWKVEAHKNEIIGL